MAIADYLNGTTARSRNIPVENRAWLFLLIATIFLFGGSAQLAKLADIPVRCAAAAALIFMVMGGSHRLVRLTSLERALCLSIIALPLVQLIPLPPLLWTLFGDRAVFADALGLLHPSGRPWMPINLGPDQGLDAALFLLVPAAMFLLGRTSDQPRRRFLFAGILTLSAFSGLLGIAQIAGGEASSLRFYELTNPHGPLGFFANRNHFALLMAVSILIAIWFAGQTAEPKARTVMAFICGSGAIAAFGLILATTSRAGILLGMIALLGGPFALLDMRAHDRRRWLVVAIAVLATLGIVALFWMEPILARFEQLAHENPRADIVPQLFHAAWANLPFGSGIGSFRGVFPRYEGIDHLNPGVWNQAHNDLVQLIIEAGLPGIAILLLFAIWWVGVIRCGWSRRLRGSDRSTVRLVILTTGLVLIHSLADYPLRTATIAGLFAFLCGIGSRLAVRRPEPL